MRTFFQSNERIISPKFNFYPDGEVDFPVFGSFTNFSRQLRIIGQMKLSTAWLQACTSCFKLNLDKKLQHQQLLRSFGLTIYLQFDFILHHVPLPDVVVGGGADEEVAVVARLGVVQQH